MKNYGVAGGLGGSSIERTSSRFSIKSQKPQAVISNRVLFGKSHAGAMRKKKIALSDKG